MHSTLALLALVSAPAAPAQGEPDPVVTAYHEACAAEDAEALAELWRENPGRVLATFDADLEGGLSIWEGSPDDPDEAAIAALHDRALWAARVASDALDHPIFADYASSFVGWDAGAKRRFRAGQAAFGRAMGAQQSGEAEEALAAGRECRELALPLGDWWGAAMGYGAEASALARLERWEEASAAAATARLLFHDLRLASSEYRALRVLVDASLAIGRAERARTAIRAAIPLAEALGDEEGLASLRASQAALGEER